MPLNKKIWCAIFLLLTFVGTLHMEKTADADEAEERFLGLKPLPIDVWYSPMDKRSPGFLHAKIMVGIQSILGLFVDVRLFPFLRCRLSERQKNQPNVACEGGMTEENAAIHQMCAFETITREAGSRRRKKSRVVYAISYILCTIGVTLRSALGTKPNYDSCRDKAGHYAENIYICAGRPQTLLQVYLGLMGGKKRALATAPHVVFRKGDSGDVVEDDSLDFWRMACEKLGSDAPEECKNLTETASISRRPEFMLPCLLTLPLTPLLIQ